MHLGRLSVAVRSDMAAMLDFDFGDNDPEVSVSDSAEEDASQEDEEEEEDDEGEDSESSSHRKKKSKPAPKKGGKKAKAKPALKVKKEVKKKKKKTESKRKKSKGDRSSVTRTSKKGDEQIMRFKNWRSVADACYPMCFWLPVSGRPALACSCCAVAVAFEVFFFLHCLRSAISRTS